MQIPKAASRNTLVRTASGYPVANGNIGAAGPNKNHASGQRLHPDGLQTPSVCYTLTKRGFGLGETHRKMFPQVGSADVQLGTKPDQG